MRFITPIAYNVIIVAVIYEALILWLVDRPNWVDALPEPLQMHLRGIYGKERDLMPIILAQAYDPVLKYTLKPGRIRHQEREFDVTYEINSQHVRDDEESLVAPSIIVLGDSHGMGFGVGQQETFAQLLERAANRKVLNGAILSYATPQEMRLLDTLDTSNLQYLIVQHCGNDSRENTSFEHGTDRVPSEEEFDQRIANRREQQEYFFGRYAKSLVVDAAARTEKLARKWYRHQFLERDKPNSKRKQSAGWRARAFLHSLAFAGKTRLEGVQVIVIDVNPYWLVDESFIENINTLKGSTNYPEYVRNLVTINLADKLDKQSFFTLDDHINDQGHRIVADEILKAIRQSGKNLPGA